MAPQFLTCSRLSSVYSPLSSRGSASLPGNQARRVPFVRPTHNISRALVLPRAVSESAAQEVYQRDHSQVQANFSPGTLAVHGGERAGRPRVSDSLTTPIVQTATYTFRNTEELVAYQEGRFGSYEYGRYGNPTSRAVEEKLCALERAEDCLVSASGMCAATTLLLALVPAGGHIVTTTDCYRRTRQFIQSLLPKMGISATVIDPSDLAELERALASQPVSLFFSESPTNPYLRCVDVAAAAELCHARGALVVIDSTLATPINQQPLLHGADLVLHSATKYLGGHNDLLAGAVAG
ncbi:Cys/Met metabolism PLP-dependent enzyme, partial [Helicosporidium sp. ATCC 50920]